MKQDEKYRRLTVGQTEAIRHALTFVRHLAEDLPNQKREQNSRRLGTHDSNALVIDGGRGSGKSTTLYLLRSLIADMGVPYDNPAERVNKITTSYGLSFGTRGSDPERSISHFLRRFEGDMAQMRGAFCVPVMDPSLFEYDGNTLMEQIFAVIRTELEGKRGDAEEYQRGRTGRPGYPDNTNVSDWYGSGYQPASAQPKPQGIDFQALLNTLRDSVERGWIFAQEFAQQVQTRDVASYDDYVYFRAVESGTAATRHQSWSRFVEQMLNALKCRLLVLFFDDFDLTPEHVGEVLKTMRLYLRHPRIIVVISAHMQAMLENYINQRMSELREISQVFDVMGRIGATFDPETALGQKALSNAEGLSSRFLQRMENAEDEVLASVAKLLPPPQQLTIKQPQDHEISAMLFAEGLPENTIFSKEYSGALLLISLRDVNFIKQSLQQDQLQSDAHLIEAFCRAATLEDGQFHAARAQLRKARHVHALIEQFSGGPPVTHAKLTFDFNESVELDGFVIEADQRLEIPSERRLGLFALLMAWSLDTRFLVDGHPRTVQIRRIDEPLELTYSPRLGSNSVEKTVIQTYAPAEMPHDFARAASQDWRHTGTTAEAVTFPLNAWSLPQLSKVAQRQFDRQDQMDLRRWQSDRLDGLASAAPDSLLLNPPQELRPALAAFPLRTLLQDNIDVPDGPLHDLPAFERRDFLAAELLQRMLRAWRDFDFLGAGVTSAFAETDDGWGLLRKMRDEFEMRTLVRTADELVTAIEPHLNRYDRAALLLMDALWTAGLKPEPYMHSPSEKADWIPACASAISNAKTCATEDRLMLIYAMSDPLRDLILLNDGEILPIREAFQSQTRWAGGKRRLAELKRDLRESVLFGARANPGDEIELFFEMIEIAEQWALGDALTASLALRLGLRSDPRPETDGRAEPAAAYLKAPTGVVSLGMSDAYTQFR